jgi:HD-like signal output (HDOD) protein/prolyl-tRNA editing enzyme YbaK/EbsC (Cys-tRNA(Pro) deacylase)
MTMIPANIQRFLDRQHAQYRVLKHPPTGTLHDAAGVCGIPERQLIRSVLLSDRSGLILAILPHHHIIDFDALCKLLERQLEPVPAERLARVFRDCDPQCCPPLPGAYGLEAIVDSRIFRGRDVYLEPGSQSELLGLDGDEYRRLLKTTRSGCFSCPVSDLRGDYPATSLRSTFKKFTPRQIKQRVDSFHDLPALPGSATGILELASDPRAGARELAAVIERDAPLAARVMRYANSPLYGYPGKIRDLQSAIARVLGFDFVLNLALGITVGKSLRIPAEGPLGLDAFWRHSVYCAALVERLARTIPGKLQVRHGTAYLAGLLHNMGILLLGQAFQCDFFLLNRYLTANPEVPVRHVEKHWLGVSHDQIGGWLLESWGLPEELVTAARHHHDESYWGDHAVYSQLVLIANCLLESRGLSFGEMTDLPAFSLEMLALDEAIARALLDELLAGQRELDNLARLVA